MINKRLRCNEYVGALITAEISKRINRLVSLGDKAGIKEFLNLFKFPEDIFVSRIYGSGILRYSETNSDIDISSKIKYTKKGPKGLVLLISYNKLLGPINSFNCWKFLRALDTAAASDRLCSTYCNEYGIVKILEIG